MSKDSVYPVQIHIGEKPIMPGDKGPQIIFGFQNHSFSQAVYFDAPQDAGEAVQVADNIYKAFLQACGNAVKQWIAHNQAEESGDES